MNRVDRIMGPLFLGLALGLFIASHFCRLIAWEPGWELWRGIAVIVTEKRMFLDALGPVLAIFATFSGGVVFSLFAVSLIRKSLLVRRFISLFSVLVLFGLCYPSLLWGWEVIGPGGICLLLSAACNFFGIQMTHYDGWEQDALRKLSEN